MGVLDLEIDEPRRLCDRVLVVFFFVTMLTLSCGMTADRVSPIQRGRSSYPLSTRDRDHLERSRLRPVRSVHTSRCSTTPDRPTLLLRPFPPRRVASCALSGASSAKPVVHPTLWVVLY